MTAAVSSSHHEYVGEGYSVRIQHCEFRFDDGSVCDEYLGVNYPVSICPEHETEQHDPWGGQNPLGCCRHHTTPGGVPTHGGPDCRWPGDGS